MKRNLIRGILFVSVTLLLPYGLTKFLNRNNSKNYLPDIHLLTITFNDNSMDFNTYLEGVIAATIPFNYELETYKVQAVIARTYALKNISSLNRLAGNATKQTFSVSEIGLPYIEPYTLIDEVNNTDYNTYRKKITTALSGTEGQVVLHDNELITPLYFLLSAGKTRNAYDVFQLNLPYLTSIDSSYDRQSQDYMKILTFTVRSVITSLNTAFSKLTLDASDYDYQLYSSLPINEANFFNQVQIVSRDSADYVSSMNLGGVVVSGEGFASALNLPSSNFTFKTYEDSIRFICKGSGHGIGLSQYGANAMSKKGYTYKEILQYYYSDTTLDELQS